MGMIIDHAKKLDNFLCLDCAEENDTKRPSNSYQTSPNYDSKVVFITRFKVCSDYLSNHDDGFFYQPVLRYTGDEVQSPVHTSIDVPSQPLAQGVCGKSAHPSSLQKTCSEEPSCLQKTCNEVACFSSGIEVPRRLPSGESGYASHVMFKCLGGTRFQIILLMNCLFPWKLLISVTVVVQDQLYFHCCHIFL